MKLLIPHRSVRSLVLALGVALAVTPAAQAQNRRPLPTSPQIKPGAMAAPSGISVLSRTYNPNAANYPNAANPGIGNRTGRGTPTGTSVSAFGVLCAPDPRGLRVLGVTGPLANVLEPGDVIVRVNDRAIRSVGALDRALQTSAGFADFEIIDGTGNLDFRRFAY